MQPPPPPESATLSRSICEKPWFPPAILALLLTILFFPAFQHGISAVISAPATDIPTQFIPWRTYTVTKLLQGDLPLWNPRTFAGQTFIGNWQTAVFYPPNLLHLLLPVGPAITLIVALHLYAAGLLTHYWLRYKTFSPLASLLGGAAFMLSGPIIGHAFPGHLTWICVVAYLPALLHCIDALLDTGRFKYALWGSLCVGLMLLAGYPQPVYITAVGCAVYGVLCLWESPHKLKAIAGFATIAILGAALGAVQVLPGLQAGADSVRSGGTSFKFATTYSLPTENLMTVFAPLAQGNLWTGGPYKYIGFGLLWEVWPTAGGITAIFALTGLLTYFSKSRRWAGFMVGLFTLFALGAETPVYHYLYTALPGVSSFRVPGRWLLIATPFFILLAAAGFDAIRLNFRRSRAVASAFAAIIGATLLAMVALRGGIHLNPDPGPYVAQALLASGLLLLTTGILLALTGKFPRILCFTLALALTELTFVAHRAVVFSPTNPTFPPTLPAALASAPKDSRVYLSGDTPTGGVDNLPLLDPSLPPNLAGYDPFQSRRWSAFMATSQGLDPREVTDFTGPVNPSAPLALLRASIAINPQGQILEIAKPLPRAFIVPRIEIIEADSARLARLTDPNFDPLQVALVEKQPTWPKTPITDTEPSAEALDIAHPGTATVTQDTGDSLTLDIKANRVAFLVLTDAYAPGWTATRTDNSAELQVLPTNHLLRGIPLTPGTYTLKLEYRPTGYLYGRWISLSALLILLTLAIPPYLRRPVARNNSSPDH